MYCEDYMKVLMMENICYKKAYPIEAEETNLFIGFKPDLHIKAEQK